MTTETAIVPAHETGMSHADAQSLAKTLAVSGIIPDSLKGKPADILVVLLTGSELGIGPMQALRSINVIKGKPVMSADLMIALAKRRTDVCEYFRLIESTEKRAIYETKRRGDAEPTRLTWTIEQAQTAGLAGGDNWRKHPAAMLRARCASALARAVYPDLLLGVYETSEGEEIQGRGQVVALPSPSGETDIERQLKASITQAKEEKAAAKELVAQAAETLDAEVVEEPAQVTAYKMPFASKRGLWEKDAPIESLSDEALGGLAQWKGANDDLRAAVAAEIARRAQ